MGSTFEKLQEIVSGQLGIEKDKVVEINETCWKRKLRIYWRGIS